MRLTSAATQSNTFCNWRYGLHRNDCAPQAILAMQARHNSTGQLIARHPVGNMPSTSSSRGDDEQMNGGRGQEHPPQIYITIAITRPQTGSVGLVPVVQQKSWHPFLSNQTRETVWLTEHPR